MYKDILAELNKDRIVNDSFISRLEKNGFEIEYGKYSYWDNQEYVQIGKRKVWLVEDYNYNNSCGIRYRYRNDFVKEVLNAIKEEKEILKKEKELEEDFFEKTSETLKKEATIERFYVIGKGVKYFETLAEAEANFNNYPTSNNWKALGVEYVNPSSKYNPCSTDMLIYSDEKEKISNDYLSSDCKDLISKTVEQLKKIRE